jgi:hypothetical protein
MSSNNTHLKPIPPVDHGTRASEESEVFSFQDEDPLSSLPSETLLNDNTTKERTVLQRKSMIKTSFINLFWILMW